MKIKKDILRLVEQLLNEVELDTTSIDLQIDKYLNSYEKASQKNADKLTLSEYVSLMLEDDADELISKIVGDEPDEDGDIVGEPKGKDNKEKKKSELDLDLDLEEPKAKKKQKEEPDIEEPTQDTGDDVAQEPEQQEQLPDDELAPQQDVAQEEPEEPVQKQRPGQIDVNVFASKVSNLVNNIENLLDVKSVIINRAHEIVLTNYSKKEAKEFKQSLASKYGLKSADAYDKPY